MTPSSKQRSRKVKGLGPKGTSSQCLVPPSWSMTTSLCTLPSRPCFKETPVELNLRLLATKGYYRLLVYLIPLGADCRAGILLPPPWDGLIIDDYFSLSIEASDYVEGDPCRSVSMLLSAKQAYASEGVLGSDPKDIIGAWVLKVAGAQIDSSEPTVSDGAALVACPAEKRLALSAASLRAAACPLISEELASMLSGAWVSCLLYRRCLMSCLDGLFGLGRSLLRALAAPSGSPLDQPRGGDIVRPRATEVEDRPCEEAPSLKGRRDTSRASTYLNAVVAAGRRFSRTAEIGFVRGAWDHGLFREPAFFKRGRDLNRATAGQSNMSSLEVGASPHVQAELRIDWYRADRALLDGC